MKRTFEYNNTFYTIDLDLADDEIYKIDKDFPAYIVTSKGRVYSLKRNRWLKGKVGSNGFVEFPLVDKDGNTRRIYAKQLVWKNFGYKKMEKGNELIQKDFNKKNYAISNLILVENHADLVKYYKEIGRHYGRPKKKNKFTTKEESNNK